MGRFENIRKGRERLSIYQDKIYPTRLPPQIENVPLLVIDTSTRSENRQSIESLVEGADVILLCYAVDMPDSIRNLRVKWLPELRKMNCNVPVVLCGCRMDLAPDQYAFDLQRAQLEELLKEHREIETAIECSAPTLSLVQEVFHFALKAVVHPQYPLYDTINQRLKPRCTQAFRRVFLLCDVDKDNRLNEEEINAFQVKCFNSPLQPDELGSVLDTVVDKLPHGVEDNGLTLAGFLFLNALFMERGGYETTWAVLRTYGYTNELTLTDDLLKGINFDPTGDQVVCRQLSDKAIQFLTAWFQKLDEDGSLALRESEIIAEMDETTPERIWSGPHWNYVLVGNSHPGRVTLEGFLCKWKYSMLIEPKATLKQLLYLGWNGGPVSDLCSIWKRRRHDKRDVGSRSIIQCMVLGSTGCGKTSLLKGLVGQANSETEDAKGDYVAVSSISLPSAGDKTLVLQEVGVEAAKKLLKEPVDESKFDNVDVAAFVFDSSDPKSFHEAQKLVLQVSSASADTLPCVFIAAKKDLTKPKELTEDIEKVCEELKMRKPIEVSTQSGELNKVYRTLTQIAIKPGPNDIPETPARKAAIARRVWMRRMLVCAGVIVAAGAASLYVVPSIKQKKNESSQSRVQR